MEGKPDQKVKDRSRLVEMHDFLGDIMYAGDLIHMMFLWQQFQKTFPKETKFIKYFEKTWMKRTGSKQSSLLND